MNMKKENLMNKRFQILTLSVLTILALFATACGAQVVRAEPAAAEQAVPKAVSYEAILGKSVNDKAIANFIAGNCTESGSLQVCPAAGIALGAGSDQIVRVAHLYIDKPGFASYKGELPLGLSSNDTMADVEYKLGHPKVFYAPHAGWEPGLPDEGYSRDLTYYTAIYRRFGLAVMYNTPAATDKDATIYAIFVGK
jgi:hypothetical protein